MEHDTGTGIVKFFDSEGNLTRTRRLAEGKRAWLTQDRFAEKYYHLSPYSYAAGNPIRYIDINGDSIWIAHKGNNYLYENGKLYQNGQEYTGKVRGFLKQTVNALNDMAGGGNFGSTLVAGLQSSEHKYTIQYNCGRSYFEPTNMLAASGNLADVQNVTGNFAGSAGSGGGAIHFDPYKQSSGFNTQGTTYSPAYSTLAHEMTHASDAKNGILHHKNPYTNSISGATYNPIHNGLNIREWRAVYVENQVRSHYGAPLRTHYGIHNGAPSGPRLLDVNGSPIYR